MWWYVLYWRSYSRSFLTCCLWLQWRMPRAPVRHVSEWVNVSQSVSQSLPNQVSAQCELSANSVLKFPDRRTKTRSEGRRPTCYVVPVDCMKLVTNRGPPIPRILCDTYRGVPARFPEITWCLHTSLFNSDMLKIIFLAKRILFYGKTSRCTSIRPFVQCIQVAHSVRVNVTERIWWRKFV